MDIVELYLSEMERAIHNLSREDLREVIAALAKAWARSATIYIIGNGGSASTASHMMNDFVKFTRVPGAQPLRAVALTDNVPLLTAVANDVSYDDVFTAALESLMRPGDVVIAISGSGNSPNVVRACEYAMANGGIALGLIGNTGGALRFVTHYSVLVPAERIGQQEDGHLIINHVIALALREHIEKAMSAERVMPTMQGEILPQPTESAARL